MPPLSFTGSCYHSCCSYLFFIDTNTRYSLPGKLLIVCNFALTLLISADLFAETHGLTAVRKWGLRILVLIICAALYFLLNPIVYEADVIRVVMLAFAFHLLVSFSPFIGQGNVNGFWEYNKSLFLQIITGGIFAGVLTLGLFIAVAAVDALFDVKMPDNSYAYIASLTMVGFLTLFFLSGVPKNFETLNESDHEYPKWLKIFTQYVLIPLLSIYLVILLVYEAKILISWELPKGYVSMLILGYAVAGILSLLLIHPIRNKEGNGWMGIFSRFFYVMMIPLVVLLLLAVWKRVSVYGITESRYILIILAVWLTIVTLYNLLSSKQNIRFIPVSLCLLALLATYGPQSAFSVSRYSQLNRLRAIFNEHNASAQKEKPEIISYLVKNHGLGVLQSFTDKDLNPLQERFDNELANSREKYIIRERLIDTALAILKVKKWTQGMYDVVNISAGKSLSVSGYDYYIPISYNFQDEPFEVAGFSFQIKRSDRLKLSLEMNGEERLLDIRPIVAKMRMAYKTGNLVREAGSSMTYELPQNGLDLPVETKDFVGVFKVTDLYISPDNKPETESFSGCFLLRLKTSK